MQQQTRFLRSHRAAAEALALGAAEIAATAGAERAARAADAATDDTKKFGDAHNTQFPNFFLMIYKKRMPRIAAGTR